MRQGGCGRLARIGNAGIGDVAARCGGIRIRMTLVLSGAGMLPGPGWAIALSGARRGLRPEFSKRARRSGIGGAGTEGIASRPGRARRGRRSRHRRYVAVRRRCFLHFQLLVLEMQAHLPADSPSATCGPYALPLPDSSPRRGRGRKRYVSLQFHSKVLTQVTDSRGYFPARRWLFRPIPACGRGNARLQSVFVPMRITSRGEMQ